MSAGQREQTRKVRAFLAVLAGCAIIWGLILVPILRATGVI